MFMNEVILLLLIVGAILIFPIILFILMILTYLRIKKIEKVVDLINNKIITIESTVCLTNDEKENSNNKLIINNKCINEKKIFMESVFENELSQDLTERTVDKAENRELSKNNFVLIKEKSPLVIERSRKPSDFERKALESLKKIWNWFVVGEEYRNPNVSQEYAIATAWLLRISMVMLLLGLGYFLKYSHENNLVDPKVRVGISTFISLGSIIFGCKLLHKRYHNLAIGICGAGFGGLYMVSFAAVSLYKICPQSIGFILLVLVAVAASLLALRINAMFLALLATFGGFVAPILMDTGLHNMLGLFSYMTLLVCGILFIAKYRKWYVLNYLVFTLTWGIFVLTPPFKFPEWQNVDIIFGIIFFFLFSSLAILYNIINRVKITLLELILMFINASLFSGIIIYNVAGTLGNKTAAVFCLSTSIYFISQLSLLIYRKLTDKHLLISLLTFSTFFLTIAFPLALNSLWISFAWSMQALAMLYVGTRLRSPFIVIFSYIIYFIVALRIYTVDFSVMYQCVNYSVNLMQRIISLGSFSLALFGAYKIIGEYGEKDNTIVTNVNISESSNILKKIFLYLFITVFFVSIWQELSLIFNIYKTYFSFIGKTFLIYFTLLIIALFCKKTKQTKMEICLVCGVILTLYFFIDIFSTQERIQHDFIWYYRLPQFIFISIILLIIAKILKSINFSSAKSFLVLSIFTWFIYSSFELSFSLEKYFSSQIALSGLSILWGLYGAIAVIYGIIKNSKATRFLGLFLFGVTTLKVLFIDLKEVEIINRVIACIIIGLIMLFSSFIYTKFNEKFKMKGS